MPSKNNSFKFLVSHAYLSKDVNPTATDRSLARFKELMQAMCHVTDIFLDCGAYTAYSRGRVVDMNDYLGTCKDFIKHGVWNYIQLDRVRDKEQTKVNLKKMLDKGLKPVPVMTMDSPAEDAAKLIKVCDGRICVAGGVKTPDKWIWSRYQKVYKASGNKALIHGLAFLRFPDLFQLPISSVDASTWANGQKYGQIKVFNRHQGMRQMQCTDIIKWGSAKVAPRILDYFKRCGVTTRDITSGDFNHGHRAFASMATVHAYLQFAKLSFDKDVRFFFVVTEVERVIMLVSVNQASRGDYFLHREAVRIKDELTAMARDHWDDFIPTICKLIKKGLP